MGGGDPALIVLSLDLVPSDSAVLVCVIAVGGLVCE